MIQLIMIYALFFHVCVIYTIIIFICTEKIQMANHHYPQEPERQADLRRSMSTHRTRAKDPPRKDKVCLQPVKYKYSQLV